VPRGLNSLHAVDHSVGLVIRNSRSIRRAEECRRRNRDAIRIRGRETASQSCSGPYRSLRKRTGELMSAAGIWTRKHPEADTPVRPLSERRLGAIRIAGCLGRRRSSVSAHSARIEDVSFRAYANVGGRIAASSRTTHQGAKNLSSAFPRVVDDVPVQADLGDVVHTLLHRNRLCLDGELDDVFGSHGEHVRLTVCQRITRVVDRVAAQRNGGSPAIVVHDRTGADPLVGPACSWCWGQSAGERLDLDLQVLCHAESLPPPATAIPDVVSSTGGAKWSQAVGGAGRATVNPCCGAPTPP